MKMQVFDDAEDYEYFLELLEIATKREKVEIIIETVELISQSHRLGTRNSTIAFTLFLR
jgi:hypothetical protein